MVKQILQLLFKPKPCLTAIDIGSHSIKIVEIKKVKGQPQIAALGSIATPPLRDGQLDQEELAKTISKLVATSGVTATEVVTSIPSSKVITHRMKISHYQQLEKEILFEVERHLSQPAEELTIRYVKLEEELLLIAVPTVLVEQYYHIFIMAGMRIVAIDFHVFGLWRLFRNLKCNHVEEEEGAIAVLEIGHRSTQLIIINDEEIKFIRSLVLGVSTVPKEEWAELAQEINGALEDYNCQFGYPPVNRIVMTGGAAKRQGLIDFLSKKCSIAVETPVPDCWQYLAKANNSTWKYDHSYAGALGLVLGEVEL